MNATEWKQYFESVSPLMEENKNYLSELDRRLGDGDHGVTMSIGWQAVQEEIKSSLSEEKDCGKIAMKVGRSFLSAVGSSVGPLYASGFINGAKAIKNKTELNEEDLIDFWVNFIKGVHERGQANIGDKTMLDTLLPVLSILEGSTEPPLVRFKLALTTAEKAMISTKDMVSQKGRSSRLGERSKGVQDPGATSAYLIFLKFVEHSQGIAKLHH
ncbi:dihydroxyacetone kinase subunit DhaL (plasmid) [Pseudalkalibacillus hwajinpoensis]|uniref:dihydroxyacetone kinase subunit DhaL n=1 Tax=Guptibacillus hwajinpoensis TaxID=208199 RepID=UPI00325AE232